MPVNTTLPPLPPPGTAFIAAIKPQLTFLLLAVGLGSPQVPIAIMLFFFSTQQTRRHPLFISNVLVCSLTLAHSILNIVIETTNILEPTRILPTSTYITQVALSFLVPWTCDAVLLVRLLAFFPKETTEISTYLRVLAFPVIVKTGRLSVVIAYLCSEVSEVKGSISILAVGQANWFRNPYVTTEWMLQVCDNAYLSSFFLYRARAFYKESASGTVYRTRTVLQRIKVLLTVALGNFVFPVIMNIVQVIFVLSDHNFTRGAYVIIANSYITPLGVLFATVWTSSKIWESSNMPSYSVGFSETTSRFRARTLARMDNSKRDAYAMNAMQSKAKPLESSNDSESEEGIRIHRDVRVQQD